jgi:hypothetical protein
VDFVNLKAPAYTADDIKKAAGAIGCEPEAIRAVWRVECQAQSYDSLGRLTMLFEPHHFYRLLSGANRKSAVALGLAYRRWRTKPYPGDSYPRLEVAIKIDEEIALQSASWGGPQIMGFNHATVGYKSAKAMVQAFLASEGAQLEAMAKFVVENGLAPALRRRDWAAFAKGYNGPKYAKNAYDKKLAQAYLHYQVGHQMASLIVPLPASAEPQGAFA